MRHTRTRSHPHTSNASPAQTQTSGVCLLSLAAVGVTVANRVCYRHTSAVCHRHPHCTTATHIRAYIQARWYTWHAIHSWWGSSNCCHSNLLIFISLHNVMMFFSLKTLVTFLRALTSPWPAAIGQSRCATLHRPASKGTQNVHNAVHRLMTVSTKP